MLPPALWESLPLAVPSRITQFVTVPPDISIAPPLSTFVMSGLPTTVTFSSQEPAAMRSVRSVPPAWMTTSSRLAPVPTSFALRLGPYCAEVE